MTTPVAVTAPRALSLGSAHYPIVLPSWRDPRLHLAAVIVSLQVLGQVAFDFRLSIAQILVSIATCAVLEVVIVLRRQQMLVWPASALLTGNGVAFILRVPGTEHGDWWSTNGWWIFAGTAAVSLLSKYLIRFRGAHVFNPSNLGLVLCFLLLGPEFADPLDFWWGPMSPALALALAIIVVGGFVILSRLRLLAMALAFWLVFVTAMVVVAATGHAMSAKWHFGPVEGVHFWTVLAFSPEILVFLFFMLTDPKSVPSSPRGRIAFAVSVASLAAFLVALSPTEFWAKVAVLGALAIVCAARPLVAFVPAVRVRTAPVELIVLGILIYVGALLVAGASTRIDTVASHSTVPVEPLPRLVIEPSRGVDSKLDLRTAAEIVADLQKRQPATHRVTLWLEAAPADQFPTIGAVLEGPQGRRTVEIELTPNGYHAANGP